MSWLSLVHLSPEEGTSLHVDAPPPLSGLLPEARVCSHYPRAPGVGGACLIYSFPQYWTQISHLTMSHFSI